MKHFLSTLSLFFGFASFASGATVVTPQAFVLNGELKTIQSVEGLNSLAISLPRQMVPEATSLTIILRTADNCVLSSNAMVLFRNYWTGYFRSPSNQFETFGDFDSALANFDNFAIDKPNVFFEITGFSQQPLTNGNVPEVGVFIARQFAENIAIVRGSEPRIISTDVRLVPEPLTSFLLVVSLSLAVKRRRCQ
jgi:hypothetical protein